MKQNLLFNQASALGKRLAMVLTMLIIVGVGQAWGETATFTATQSGGWTTNAGAQSGTIDGVTLAVTNGINNGTQLRCYANATMTISSTNNITKIVVTCTSTSNGPSNFSLSNSTGNYSNDGTTGTWEGSATSVSLNASAQVRMTQIDVTYESATPKQEYTLTYQSGETSGTLQVEEEANLLEALSVLETPVSCDATSTKFVGWTTTEITEKTNTEPTFLTDSDVMPSENYAVYAVFAREESVPGGTSWEKVTSSKTDWSGVYVLTASEYVLDYSTSSTAGNATKFSTAGLSVNDNTLTGVTDKYTVTIEKSGSYYTVSLNGKGYLTLASNSNTVSRTTSVTGNNQKWTISWADNTAHLYSVSYTSRELQKNNSNAYMRCYTGTQTDLTWYEQTSSYTTAYYDYITTCTTETLVSVLPKITNFWQSIFGVSLGYLRDKTGYRHVLGGIVVVSLHHRYTKNRFSSYQYVKDRFRRIVPFRVANNRAFFCVSRGQVNDQCLRRNVLARRNSFTRVWLAVIPPLKSNSRSSI